DFDSVIDYNQAIEFFDDPKPHIPKVIYDLWFIGGKSVVVRKDGNHKTVIDYENSLPSDLKPVLVLDASARIRRMYHHWSNGRGDLTWLMEAPKQYHNLTAHIWPRGGGHQTITDDAKVIVEGVAKTIETKPNEEWLVVHHKADKKLDVPRL